MDWLLAICVALCIYLAFEIGRRVKRLEDRFVRQDIHSAKLLGDITEFRKSFPGSFLDKD